MSENGQAEPRLVAERVRKVCRTGGVEVGALAGLDLTVCQLNRGRAEATLGVRHGGPQWAYA